MRSERDRSCPLAEQWRGGRGTGRFGPPRRGQDVSDRFEADVRRMQRALAAEKDRRARRLSRRDERRERRAARRGGRQRKPRSGVGLLIGAAVLTVVVVDGAPFWLLFIALWMIFEGMRRLVGRRAPEVEG